MSLLVWLPLISNTVNKGLLNSTITTTGTISYSAGKIGNAITFNTSSIVLKPAPLTTSTKEFSFAFWYKPTSINSYQCLYNGRTAVGAAIAIFRSPENKWRFDDGTQHMFNDGSVINEWHHYVFTRDESNIKLYIDGVLKQTITASSFTCATASASIGLSSTSNAAPGSNPIIGQLNDYRIYDHVLSQREIKELSKGLIMHLPLDWGANPNLAVESQTLNNSSGNSGNYTHETRYYDGYPVRRMTVKAVSYGPWCSVFDESKGAVPGEVYTWSMDIRGSGDFKFTNIGHERAGAGFTCNVTTEWQHIQKTWTYSSSGNQAIIFYNCSEFMNKIGAWIEVRNLKIEKGSVATPYIPNVNEAAYTAGGYANKYTEDCSGYQRAVTVTSNSTISIATDSPRGTGTNINKTGKLTIANSFPVGVFPLFTVNGWIRTTARATQSLWNDFFGISANNYAGSNSLFRMEVASTAGTSFNWFGPMQKDAGGLFSMSITAGQWYMITLVSDGTKFIGYRNAVQYGTSTPADKNKANWQATGTFYIGDSNIYFDVADVRVYATALSADDIKALYSIAAEIDKSGKIYCSNIVET